MMDSDSDDEVEHLQYKVIVMGDGAVGKTSLINRYCQDGFAQSYKQTIGVDFFNKKIVLPGQVNVTLQIWDIGGQQIGGKMLGKYIFGCAAVLLVYDTTNPDSFKNVDDWLTFVREEFRNNPKQPHISLVGNKIDLAPRQVKPEKHNAYSTDHHLVPHFVSAKSGEKVNAMFTKIAAELTGVQLTKAEVEGEESKVTASIVQHQAAPTPGGSVGPQPEKESGGDCNVM